MTPAGDPADLLPLTAYALTPEVWAVPDECLDAACGQRVWDELAGRLGEAPLVLDLGAVRFADSVGIALLARAQARHPGRVWVANVYPPLQRCLDRAPPSSLPPRVPAATLAPSTAVA